MLVHGDCLEVLPTLDADSIDSCCTDPPYGLSFMGKNWDHGVPGEHFWREVLRVLKPGAHLLAFGGTRTYHRLTCAIEDAGFEIRDCLMWVYGSGFAKGLNVSKAIDELHGAEREVVGYKPIAYPDSDCWGTPNSNSSNKGAFSGEIYGDGEQESGFGAGTPITAPATEDAKKWDGFGTALKPAYEPIILARKPFKGTVAQNVLEYGTGALNIDACRVEFIPNKYGDRSFSPRAGVGNTVLKGGVTYGANQKNMSQSAKQAGHNITQTKGRWPSNFIHDGSDEVTGLFPETTSGGADGNRRGHGPSHGDACYGEYKGLNTAGGLAASSGSAARFFYCAKSSKAERNRGCEGMEKRAGGSNAKGYTTDVARGLDRNAPVANSHPTVKPISLMRYLCKLITPPKGIVLDPFMGSGSTGLACVEEGFEFVGIELDKHYLEIAQNRINAAQPTLF